MNGQDRRRPARISTTQSSTRLEPLGQPDHTGAPTSFRVRRAEFRAEPRLAAPPARLLYLPPIWSRASFWLPIGLPVPALEPPTTDAPIDPGDDFAA